LGNYCGGTFQGLQSKLAYIQGMGFDAIWITPVVASKSHVAKAVMELANIAQTILEAIMAIGLKIYIRSTPTMERRKI
jgi:hypothetical protein